MTLGSLVGAKELHHAYLIAGNAAFGADEAVLLLQKRGITTAGNPDFYRASYAELGVEEARRVSEFASLKPLGESKYIIVSWSRATTQAQNALLKAIEDAGSSVFFISVDSQGHALPTIRSRCIVVSSEAEVPKEDVEEAQEFLKASYEERMSKVEKMASAISKTQDRTRVRSLVRSLMAVSRNAAWGHKTVRDLLDADSYLRMQGGSAKAVLAHLAVTLPRTR